jgi:hypothetical protein
MKFDLLKDTKTCYRFENKDGGNLTTLYLKKADIEDAGIDPHKGIIVTVEEAK